MISSEIFYIFFIGNKFGKKLSYYMTGITTVGMVTQGQTPLKLVILQCQ